MDQSNPVVKNKFATQELFGVFSPYISYRQASDAAKALAAGADVNARSSNQRDGLGARPIHRAAGYGSPETVKLLLEAGAKLNLKDERGQTPLHWVGKNADSGAAIAKLLIDAGAKVDAKDKKGMTPLALALKDARDSFATAEALLEGGASWAVLNDCESHPMHEAAKRLDAEAVIFMLKQGVSASIMDKKGLPPMMALMQSPAFSLNQPSEKITNAALRVFDALREGGATVLSAYPVGSPNAVGLMMAGLSNGAPAELLKRALLDGASLDGARLSNNYVEGPAMMASQGRLDRLRLGFSLGLDVKWQDEREQSLCHWAMESRFESMFDTLEGLLKDGANPNSKSQYGETLLQTASGHEIASAGNKLVQILLDHGADPNGLTGPRNAPLLATLICPRMFTRNIYSRPSGRLGIIQALVAAGANVNALASGAPLLCHANGMERDELLRLGADPTMAALCLAKNRSPEDIYNVETLKEWVGYGAKVEALMSAYDGVFQKAPAEVQRRLENSGAFAYLEALALRESVLPVDAPRARSPSI